MTVIPIANVLQDRAMRTRFRAEPAQIALEDGGVTHRMHAVLGVPMLSSSDALKAMASMGSGEK